MFLVVEHEVHFCGYHFSLPSSGDIQVTTLTLPHCIECPLHAKATFWFLE